LSTKGQLLEHFRTPLVGILYIEGVSEKLRRMYNRFGVSMYLMPTNTLIAALVRPKNKSDPQQQCGVLYRITCDDCAEQYIGETEHKGRRTPNQNNSSE